MVFPYDPKNLSGSFTPSLGINKKGIQSGLNFIFPKANFDFAGENNEEIIDDNEIIKINPPIPGKSLISDEIQKQLNLLLTNPNQNIVDDNVQVNDGEEEVETDGEVETDINIRSPISEEQLKFDQEEAGGVKTESATGVDKFNKAADDMFSSALNSYQDVFADKTPTVGKIEDYKQEFYEATGLDPSGKPDLRTAATAFGLALMQNKAGKGFNIGRIMAEIGKAGEKALPLAEKARQQAKAEEIAAGRYALGEVAKDKAARDAAIQNQINAELELKKEMRKLMGDKYLKELEYFFKQRIELIKNQGLVDAEAAKAKNAGLDLILPTIKKPIDGIDSIQISYANKKKDGQSVFVRPSIDVMNVAKGYTDTLEAQQSLTKVVGLLRELAQNSTASSQVLTFFDQKIVSLFGENYSFYQDEEGKVNRPLDTIEKIKDRIIAQYKRFLTQETGNGISNQDVERIAKALGDLNFLGDPTKIADKVEETMKIFESRRMILGYQLEQFQDRDMYLNEKEYEKTQSQIDKQLIASISEGGGSIGTNINYKPIAESPDGVPLFDVIQ